MSIRLSGPSEKIPQVSTADLYDMSPGEKAELFQTMKLGSAALEASEFNFTSSLSRPNAHATFVTREDFANDREESKHQVEFGQFILNAKGTYEQPFFGATKPLEDIGDLITEFEASEYLNTISDRQLAYLPLGVWKNVEGIIQYISLYEHDVTTYDRVFWADRNITPEALRPDIVEESLHGCMTGIGYLHGAGIVHGDAEVKNLAQDRQGIRFVDLEDVKHLARVGNKIEDSPVSTKLMRCDIESFIDSTLMVEDNHDKIKPTLAKRTTAARLAKDYRNGLRLGRNDTGLISPKTALQTEGYFQQTIDHALGLTRTKASS